MLQYVYKVINNNVPTYLNDMFEVEENIHNTRCFMRIKQHQFKTIKHGFNSISYQGAKLWNMLPTVFKDCKSYIHFKHALSEWNGLRCQCTVCIQCKM